MLYLLPKNKESKCFGYWFIYLVELLSLSRGCICLKVPWAFGLLLVPFFLRGMGVGWFPPLILETINIAMKKSQITPTHPLPHPSISYCTINSREAQSEASYWLSRRCKSKRLSIRCHTKGACRWMRISVRVYIYIYIYIYWCVYGT